MLYHGSPLSGLERGYACHAHGSDAPWQWQGLCYAMPFFTYAAKCPLANSAVDAVDIPGAIGLGDIKLTLKCGNSAGTTKVNDLQGTPYGIPISTANNSLAGTRGRLIYHSIPSSLNRGTHFEQGTVELITYNITMSTSVPFFYVRKAGGGNYRMQLSWSSTTIGSFSYRDSGDSIISLTPVLSGSTMPTIATGRILHTIFTWAKGDNAYLYINGLLIASTSAAGNNGCDFYNGGDVGYGMTGGSDLSTPSSVWTDFYYAAVYDRVVSAAWVRNKYADPYGLLRLNRRPFHKAPASGFTGTLGALIGQTTFSGAATFQSQHTATASLTIGHTLFVGTATFTKPSYTGSISVSTGAAIFAGAATFAVHTYTASMAVSVGPPVFAGNATFTKPSYTGVLSVSVGASLFAGSAAFVKPSYTGSLSLSTGSTLFTGVASFTKPVDTGVLTVSTAGIQFSGNASFTKPSYTSVGTWLTGPATFSGVSTFAPPTSTGSLTVTVGAALFAGVGVGDIDREAILAVSVGPTTFVGIASVPPYIIYNRVIVDSGNTRLEADNFSSRIIVGTDTRLIIENESTQIVVNTPSRIVIEK